MQVTKSPKTMRFKFAIQASWRTAESRLLCKDGEVDQKTKKVIGLLKALQWRINTEVEIEEIEGEIINERLKEWKMEDAEIDEWEKVLLNDSDIDL